MQRRSLLLGVFTLAAGLFLVLSFSISLLGSTLMVGRLENGTYGASVRSVLQDRDLNIINHVPPAQRWLVTKTYNSPDIRENGTVGLWLPFFMYGRLLPTLHLGQRPQGKPLTHDDAATSLATLFFTLASLILSLRVLEASPGGRHSRLTIGLFALGTPLLWYLVFEPSGTDLNAGFALSATLFLYSLLLKYPSLSPRWHFLLGAFTAFGYCVKAYGVFYLIISFQFALRWWSSGRPARLGRQVASLALGQALVLACLIVNQVLKFGSVELGQAYIELNRFSRVFASMYEPTPIRQLFDPNGAFFVAPIYLLSVVGAGLWLFDLRKLSRTKLKEELLSARAVALTLPIAAVLTACLVLFPALIGTARRFMAQQLGFALMFQMLLAREETLGKRFQAFLAVAVVAVVWGAVQTLRFAGSSDVFGDLYLVTGPQMMRILENVSSSLGQAFAAYPRVSLSMIGWIPALLLCSAFLVALWRSTQDGLTRSQPRDLRAVALLLGVPVILYVIVSGLNLLNNRSKVARLQREGFFASTVVGDGMALFTYDESIGYLPMLRRLSKTRRAPEIERETDQATAMILSEAGPQAAVDPIGFARDCARGKVRPSFFDFEEP